MRWLFSLALVLALTRPMFAEPVNVLMIVSDDMGWTDYGFMGHPTIKTPHLDKLAASGAVYPNSFVSTSLCRASLATLLTGLYAHQHFICCNDPPVGVDRSQMLPFLRDAPTIPRLLKDRGYVSFQTGKFWEGHFSNGGFTHGMTMTGRHGEEGLEIGRKTLKPMYEFIENRGDKPFFVWYAPMMPHLPHTPPDRILKKYAVDGRDIREAKYWAMCEWFDETVGELLGWLDDKKLADNTLVVYCTDNGWVQATGPVKKNDQFGTRSKNTAYDAGLRTPVILRWPGKIKPARYDGLVSTIDLAPTILSACGAKPSPRMVGLDLIATPTARPANTPVFGEIFQHNCVKLGEPATSLTHRWIRRGEWKLIVPAAADKQPELYRVASDPSEKTDLAGREPKQVAELRALLDAWWEGR